MWLPIFIKASKNIVYIGQKSPRIANIETIFDQFSLLAGFSRAGPRDSHVTFMRTRQSLENSTCDQTPSPPAHIPSPTLCTRANYQTFYPNISATIRPEELRFNFGGKQSYLTYPKLPEIQTDVQTDRDRRIGFTLFSTQWCLTLMLWLLELKYAQYMG